jgi:hypothetical protein
MTRGTDSTFRTGDWAQIKSPLEIAQTLDANGMLNGMPFMPEMLELCGRTFQIARRAEKTCIEYPGGGYKIRQFLNEDTVLLEEIRCSGKYHGDCQRACMIFWNTAWLRKVNGQQATIQPDRSQTEQLRAKLKTMASATRYICQSTELAQATKHLGRATMLLKCLREVQSGSRGLFEIAKMMLVPAWRKATRRIPRRRLTGTLKRTPVGHLGLQPGELITVRPASEIAKTLDQRGRNRGLTCDFGMSDHSGEKLRVRSRLDRMISEVTGEMRQVEGTVIIEGLNCTCSNVFGGCPRQDFTYWREIWLERINNEESHSTQGQSEGSPEENLDLRQIHEDRDRSPRETFVRGICEGLPIRK